MADDPRPDAAPETGKAPRPTDRSPPRPRPPQDSGNRGVVGVVFVVLLVVLAGYLVNRMTYYASLGDCAFTHAPQCRALLP